MPIRHHAAIPSLIITPHAPKFTQFMNVKAGEIVTVGKEDDQYPGWLWCTDSHGISNWAPREFLKIIDSPQQPFDSAQGDVLSDIPQQAVGHEEVSKPQGFRPTENSNEITPSGNEITPSRVEGRAEFLVDYDATELTVQVGETVIVYSEQSGWLWCRTTQGKQGWIPKTCVAG